MPKELQEIKEFNLGTIFNADEKDISPDSNIFSFNLNPTAPHGILDSIKTDRLITSVDNSLSFFIDPVSNGSDTNEDVAASYNQSRIYINDISKLDSSKSVFKIAIDGNKGKRETLILKNIEPVFNPLLIDNDTIGSFTIAENFTETSDSILLYSTVDGFSFSESVTSCDIISYSTAQGEVKLDFDNDAAADLDNDTFTLKTRDGKQLTYIYTDDNTNATGTVDGSGRVRIQIYGDTTGVQFADETVNAINHANGHGTGRVTCYRYGGGFWGTSDNVMIKDKTHRLPESLTTGDFFSFAETDGSPAFTGRTGFEILQVESFNHSEGRIYVKRNCFGTTSTALTTGTSYTIYANKVNIGAATFDNQNSSTIGTCEIDRYSWTSISERGYIGKFANNIGGNSHYLYKCDSDSEKQFNGSFNPSVSNQSMTYDATAKTIKFGTAISSFNFKMGDVVTIYHSNGGNNNGNRYRILAIGDSLTLHGWTVEVLEGTMVSETENANMTVSIEANLIKNHTFEHGRDDSPFTTGDDKQYPTDAWEHKYYYNTNASASTLYNYYLRRNSNVLYGSGEEVTMIASGGVWDGHHYPYESADASANYYPFQSNDKFIEIKSEYAKSDAVYPSVEIGPNDTTIKMNQDMTYQLAYNDIITFENNTYDGNTEYMRVLAVNSNIITVERGVYNTSPDGTYAATTSFYISKNLNHHIQQTIGGITGNTKFDGKAWGQSGLKPGQTYRFSFYAKRTSAAYAAGGLALVYNGGFFNANGDWSPFSSDTSRGLMAETSSRVTTEEQWIDFNDITTPLGNSLQPSDNGVDFHYWHKYEIKFTLPKELDNPSELLVKFCSKGKEATKIHIDLVSLIEHHDFHVISNDSAHITSMSFINNTNLNTLLLYDNTLGALKAFPNFNMKSYDRLQQSPTLSTFATSDITSSTNRAAFTARNRESHIGFGGQKSDTAPQWLGYVNHKVFGLDSTQELYQDEDTVHKYDEEGVTSLSKITIAGEHEYLVGTWTPGSPGHLTINHTAHPMKNGDNIIVREWMDVANKWPGSGLWIVTDASATDSFQCKRYTTKDAEPPDATGNFLATGADNTRNTNTGRINYRPYYYYGIKNGGDKIYRITPETRIKSDLSVDTDYTGGLIESSGTLPTAIASITTCHNKVIAGGDGVAGTGGGKIYCLSADSDTVYAVDVNLPFDEWGTTLSYSTLSLEFKSFKWSNDNVNGNIGGTTEVFPGGGLAIESSPTIKYDGRLSDILETKGTTATFNIKSKRQEENQPNDFDTRLWVQCTKDGDNTFTEGSRFLFCGLTNTSNADTDATIKLGDRTPPTTAIVNRDYPTAYGSSNTESAKFLGAPGIDLVNASDEVRKYGYFSASMTESSGKLKTIEPVHDGDSAKGNPFSSGGRNSFFQFGFNVGWSCGTESNIVPPSIETAQYGLFQMADNDMDGLIDGTGVVCANDISLGVKKHGTASDAPNATQPYGRPHRRVTSHVVGLMGRGNNNWVRHWGALMEWYDSNWIGGQSFSSIDEDHGGEAGQDCQDAPEEMAVGPCVFVCSDIHYGDIYPDFSGGLDASDPGPSYQYYYINDGSTGSAADNLGVAPTKGMKIKMANQPDVDTLQGGDTVYLFDMGTDQHSYSFTSYISGIKDDYLILPYSLVTPGVTQFEASTLALCPHSTSEPYRNDGHLTYGDDDTTWDGVNELLNPWHGKHGSCLKRNETIYHYSYDKDNPLNGDIFTEGVGCGKYTRTFITPPSQHGYSGDETIGNVAHRKGYTTNPYRPGFVNCIEKLSFRSGYMIRPLAVSTMNEYSGNSFEDFIFSDSICVDMPCFPTAPVLNAQNGDYLHYSIDNGTIQALATDANSFANKLFISSKREDGKSYMFLLDPTFMFPDEGLHRAVASGGTEEEDSDTFNGGKAWDILLMGQADSDSTLYGDDITGSHDLTPFGTESVEVCISPGRNICNKFIMQGVPGDIFLPHNNDVRTANGVMKNFGFFAGMCITFIHRYTRTMETRYILNSYSKLRSNEDHENHLILHYPVKKETLDGSIWYIWKHSDVCTAPMRLYAQQIISEHGKGNKNIGGDKLNDWYGFRDYITNKAPYSDTGLMTVTSGVATTKENKMGISVYNREEKQHNLFTGDVIEVHNETSGIGGLHTVTVTGNSNFTAAGTMFGGSGTMTTTYTNLIRTSASANPLELDLSKPIFKTMFGGLNMRKLRQYTGRTGDPAIDANGGGTGEAKMYLTANHLLSDGDRVTFDKISTGQDDLQGATIIKDASGVEFDFLHAGTTDTNENGIPVYTNQWDSFVFETGGLGRIGNLSAGLTSWDKGNRQDNIIRYDTTSDESRYMRLLKSIISITSNTSGDVDGDYFLKNKTYQYKISLIYDGYQEGPISDELYDIPSDVMSKSRSKIHIKIGIENYSKRLTHVCLYRRDNTQDFYSLVKEIPTDSGWTKSEGVYYYTVEDDGPLGASYESRTGLSEILDTIQLKYGLSAEVDGYLFVGDCGHKKIENASNIIFRSKPGMFSIFDYSNDYLIVKSKPTAMANFLGKLYVFDKNNTYKINPQTMFIEDTFEGVGCSGPNAIIVTEYGMFFASKNGAYRHDGNSPIKISLPIEDGGDLDSEIQARSSWWHNSNNSSSFSWNSVIKNSKNPPMVTFDASTNSALFFFENFMEIHAGDANITLDNLDFKHHHIWAYNIPNNRWDLWEFAEESRVGAPTLSEDGEVLIPVNNVIYSLKEGANKKHYTWVSKKINAGQDSVIKIYKNIKINGVDTDINAHSEKLYTFTNTSTAAPGNTLTYKDKNQTAEYKVSGNDRKGKWIQIVLRRMDEEVDSIGIVFRRGPVK